MKKSFSILIFIAIFSFSIPSLVEGESATLYLAPSGGTFFVGSTFGVSVYLNTKGNKINAVEVDLRFDPQILQVSTPTAGESFISEWIVPPNYSNVGGVISFKGGIPEGIVTSAGLVSTITFRAKSPGKTSVEVLDSSRVLLADGKGTPILTTNIGGSYEVLVPPPEGPKIFSPTHPDQEVWYSNSSPQFSWEKEEGMTEFSFALSQNPQENPDTVSEGNQTFKSYDGVGDGVWYFHLRAKKKGVWGKSSHFAARIDTSPPQEFEPEVETYSGFIYFETKDLHSGIDYYEASVLNLSKNPEAAPLFVEATSPFKTPFEQPGEYNVIVRAYDRAGNYRTAEIGFQMVSSIFAIGERGIYLGGTFLPLWLIFLILFILIGGFGYLAFYLLRRRPGFKKGIKEIEEALKEIRRVEEKERETAKLKEKFKQEKEELEEKLMEE